MGTTHRGRRFDRIHQPDERNWSVVRALEPKPLRSYTWRCPTVLDQGSDGACVGFAFAHELAARPRQWTMAYPDAMEIYHQAQQEDEWDGTDYEGTSVLAGAKACQMEHRISEYHWAGNVFELALGLGYHGPAVLGVWWREGMWEPGADGYVRVTGDRVGGHAILCNGVSIVNRRFRLHQSWGPGWGMNGECWVDWDDMRALLADEGEACFPVDLKPPRTD